MKSYLDYCDGLMQPQYPSCPMPQPGYALSALPKNPVTAMAYVPFQTDSTMYEAEKALCCGTAFPDLDKPFYGGKCGC